MAVQRWDAGWRLLEGIGDAPLVPSQALLRAVAAARPPRACHRRAGSHDQFATDESLLQDRLPERAGLSDGAEDVAEASHSEEDWPVGCAGLSVRRGRSGFLCPGRRGRACLVHKVTYLTGVWDPEREALSKEVAMAARSARARRPGAVLISRQPVRDR
jgi:hypothetical protein